MHNALNSHHVIQKDQKLLNLALKPCQTVCGSRQSRPIGGRGATPWVQCCQALPFNRWTSFSRILVWFCGFYSQYFLNRKQKGKTMRHAWENDSGITRPSHFTKKVGHTGTGTALLPDSCFTVTCETERGCGDKKGQVKQGDTVAYHCFSVHHLAWKTHLRVQQNTPLTYSKLTFRRTFCWRTSGLKSLRACPITPAWA